MKIFGKIISKIKEIDLSLIQYWIQKIKSYITLKLNEDPVSRRSLLRHMIGILKCSLLYDASIVDYFELRYFEKTHKERKTFFTKNEAHRFIIHMNGAENHLRFQQKNYMYQVLGKFTKREQLFLPTEDYQAFESFFQRHRTALYKARGICGDGVELWSADNSDIKKLFERSLEKPAILDELVVQHPDIARLNPDSVNTVKLFTLMLKEECRFIAAELRMGRRGAFVDNIEKGGLAANVEIKTGKVIGTAYDVQTNQYTFHPDTGVKITDYIIPNWEEVLRFCEECARACPLAYVEWDIAIREKDCVLIEANSNARNVGIQLGPLHVRKKEFEELEKLYDCDIYRLEV